VNAGLVRYLLAAALVRGADSAAPVALILLAVSPGLQVSNGPVVGGVLAAALSAPHLIGPWLGHRLDRAPDARRMLSAAYLLYAVALAAGSLLLGHVPVAAAIAAVAVAGACGPLLTGGLSSRMTVLAGPSVAQQRRVQGWDGVTYGVAGTAGPAVVAGIATLAGPLPAVLTLSAAAVVGAILVRTLPVTLAAPRHQDTEPLVTIGASMRLMVTDGPLRRVTTLMLITALGTGALPVIATALGIQLTDQAASGATLTAASGFGGLIGALLAVAIPLRGDPDRATIRTVVTVAAATALCAVAPNFVVAVLGFALIGATNARFFTSTLAARATYAPPVAHAKIFITGAGLKMATASIGAAVAGTATPLGGHVLLMAVAVLIALGASAALVDRLLGAHSMNNCVNSTHLMVHRLRASGALPGSKFCLAAPQTHPPPSTGWGLRMRCRYDSFAPHLRSGGRCLRRRGARKRVLRASWSRSLPTMRSTGPACTSAATRSPT
jgi:MFS family permease